MALIKCRECGKEFSDQAIACPNCACPVNIYYSQREREYESTNPIAITGFVLSFVSIFIHMFWGVIGICGTIFSIIGIIITFTKKKKGKVLAILGLIMGIVGTALGVTFWNRIGDIIPSIFR